MDAWATYCNVFRDMFGHNKELELSPAAITELVAQAVNEERERCAIVVFMARQLARDGTDDKGTDGWLQHVEREILRSPEPSGGAD